ncbi:MAG: protein kinase domain-containing protein, partial [Bryobacteraceae bacterium]
MKLAGRYELKEELGRGGQAVVYRAIDETFNDRPVAVKLLLTPDADPDLYRRFQLEADTLAKLRHPNIVTVLDFGQHEGRPYLVMEYLEGHTLSEEIEGRVPVTLLRKVEIMREVAEGLRYAHSNEVIHRDIKPNNIMVLATGEVKITDFGIARVMGSDGSRRTKQGEIIGTVSYMAPERFREGRSDDRTDIFAFGVLYYELLTGHNPFRQDEIGATMYRISTYDPPPVHELIPNCPIGLELLIEKLIAKDRDARYERLDDLLFDAQPILQNLRHVRASELFEELRPRLEESEAQESSHPGSMQAELRQILELDPGHADARWWREKLRKEAERRQLAAKLSGLKQEAVEHQSARRFGEAVDSLEKASKLDKNDPEIRSLLESAKAMLGNVRKARTLSGQARADGLKGGLETAFEKASEAVELDPGNAEAVALRDSFRLQIRSRNANDALQRADELRKQTDYDSALNALAEIAPDLPIIGRAVAMRVLIEQERAEAERRRRHERFQREREEARQALERKDLDEAKRLAERLCVNFPEETSASALLAEALERIAAEQRAIAIRKLAESSRELIDEQGFEEAVRTLEEALRTYPEASVLVELKIEAGRRLKEKQRSDAINKAVTSSEQLSTAGQLEEALRLVRLALNEFGTERILLDIRRDLSTAIEQRDYRAGLERTLAEANRLLAAGQVHEALASLEREERRFSSEAGFQELLKSVREAVETFEQRQFVSIALERADHLDREGRYDEALREISVASARYPENIDLRTAGEHLEAQYKARRFVGHQREIQAAIENEDWDLAAKRIGAAEDEFRNESFLSEALLAVNQGRYRKRLHEFESSVRKAFDRDDLASAAKQLSSNQKTFSEDSLWQTLDQELKLRQKYVKALREAQQALASENFGKARELLSAILNDAPDPRARDLLQLVDLTQRQREAEEAARRKREESIAKGRAEAAALLSR